MVTKDVPPGCVVAGNPARIISTVDEWAQRIKDEFENSPVFSESYTMRKNVSDEKKKEMLEKMGNMTAYVE